MLAVLAVVMAAATKPPAPVQWYCQGIAKGARESQVEVDLYVETNGHEVGRSASWDPPTLAKGPRLPGTPRTTLTLLYTEAAQAGLGAPTEVLPSAASDTRHVLDNSLVSIALDDGRPWALSLEPLVGTADTLPVVRFGSLGGRLDQPEMTDEDVLAAVAAAHAAQLTLKSRDGRTLGWARYDLSALSERDRLFRQAWAAARAAALHPRHCMVTVAPPEVPEIDTP